MTLDVYRGRKTTIQQYYQRWLIRRFDKAISDPEMQDYVCWHNVLQNIEAVARP